MIRAVICDVGDMLLRYRWQIVLARLSRFCGREPDYVFNIMLGTQHSMGFAVYEHDRGTLDTTQFISALRELLKIGSEVSDERIADAFTGCFEFSGETRRLLYFLRDIYTLGIISNMNPLQWKHIIQTFPTLHRDSGVFSFYALSYEELIVKPDRRIYELAFQRARLAAGEKFGDEIFPENCVFLDDRTENVEAARAFGMQGIIVREASYSDIADGLFALGVVLPLSDYRPDPFPAPGTAGGRFHIPFE